VISASIVFVAVQNLAQPRRSYGVSRVIIAFLFGLFHGLGFAGGLMDLMHAMSHAPFVLALVGFSLGVEAGNQVVLLPSTLSSSVRVALAERSDRGLWMTTRTRLIVSGIVAAGGAYFLGLALLAPTRGLPDSGRQQLAIQSSKSIDGSHESLELDVRAQPGTIGEVVVPPRDRCVLSLRRHRLRPSHG
jgi:xanthosine utilization system XapX-like protein